MAEAIQQLLTLLGNNGGKSLVQSESTMHEQVIPTEIGGGIVIQQRRDIEREIKKVQPQLDFTSVDFCAGETIKLMNKLQLIPAIPYNLLKLEYRTIRNARCLIATAQANFGDPIEGHEDFPSIIEMTVSNKWSKILASLVGTSNVKYIVATRCNMFEEQSFNDKKYATMKYEFIKSIVKKHMDICDDETVVVDLDNPSLSDEIVKKAVRKSSDLLSRTTYQLHRRNLIWDEEKYKDSMTASKPSSRKRKNVIIEEDSDEVIKKTTVSEGATVDLEDVE